MNKRTALVSVDHARRDSDILESSSTQYGMQSSSDMGVATELGLDFDETLPGANRFRSAGVEIAGPVISLNNQHLAPRTQKAGKARQSTDRVGKVLKEIANEQIIEALRLEGRREEIGSEHMHTLKPTSADALRGQDDRVERHVERHETAAGAEGGHGDSLGTDTAADLENDAAVREPSVVVDQISH
ncbi:MAG: hypothetical protein Q8N53_11380 [Longimicrobiales bacterium]|nr:hypothetical protein [Longimicrobiales bacterium]